MYNPFRLLFKRQRTLKRDFGSSSRAANPMFRTTAPRRAPWKIVAVLIVVFGAWCYTLFAPQYRVTAIEVTGAVKVDQESIVRFLDSRLNADIFGLRWKRVYYLTPLTGLTRDLKKSVERLVSVNELTITRRGRNTLVVSVSERTPNLIWETSYGNRYTVDEKGIVIERIPGDAPQGFNVLKDQNRIPVALGMQVVRPEYLASIAAIAQALQAISIEPTGYATWKVECRTISPTPASNTNRPDQTNTNQTTNVNSLNINIPTNANKPPKEMPEPTTCDPIELAINDPTVVVLTSEGWEIRLDTSSDIDAQLKKLQIALTERLSGKRTSLRYIDVRFGNKVYYQ